MGGKIYRCLRYKGINHYQYIKWWKDFFKLHPYKVIHSHSTSSGKEISAFIKNAMKLSLRFEADLFLGCSQEAVRWLFGRKICESSKFYILKNAIDIEKYIYNSEIRRRYRKKLGIDDKFVIGHVGRFTEAKNHEFILDIFEETHKKNNKAI